MKRKEANKIIKLRIKYAFNLFIFSFFFFNCFAYKKKISKSLNYNTIPIKMDLDY